MDDIRGIGGKKILILGAGIIGFKLGMHSSNLVEVVCSEPGLERCLLMSDVVPQIYIWRHYGSLGKVARPGGLEPPTP